MKVTAIIATAIAPLETFKWSICSLLLRTPKEILEEVIVSINGPDLRTGHTKPQDEKQEFLESLKDLGFPITIVRTWSRLGFSQPYEMCLPLCKTDFVLLMHDDVIIIKDNWYEEIDECTDITTIAPILGGKLLPNHWVCEKNIMRMDFPYINSAFIVIKKDVITVRWFDYYINLDVMQDSRTWHSLKKFFHEHKNAVSIMPDEDLHKNIAEKSRMACPSNCYNYSLITFPMGAWVYYYSVINNLKIKTFSNNTVEHLEAMSWKEGKLKEVEEPMPVVIDLIDKIKLPIKVFRDYKIPKIDEIKPLVGIITYKRTHTIDAWLRAWNNAEHYGGKVIVIHNFDEELSHEEKNNILKHHPDFYVPRNNIGRDIGAFKDLVYDKITVSHDWNVLVWFTDDIIPMRRDFLLPLLREISKPEVGVVGGWLDGNIRTVCFAIKRELAKQLVFVDNPFEMERGPKSISTQIRNMGFKVNLPTQVYSPKYAWDCDYEGIVDLWDKYEAQF